MENQENKYNQENQNPNPSSETSTKKVWIKPMMEELLLENGTILNDDLINRGPS